MQLEPQIYAYNFKLQILHLPLLHRVQKGTCSGKKRKERETKILVKWNFQGCCFKMYYICLSIYLFTQTPFVKWLHRSKLRINLNLKATNYLTDWLPCFCEVRGNQRTQRKAIWTQEEYERPCTDSNSELGASAK